MSSTRTERKHRPYILWLPIAIGSIFSIQLSAAFWRSPARAQTEDTEQAEATATKEEITSYASTVSAIEPLRLAAYEAASDALVAANSEVNLVDSQLSCLSSSLEDMPETDAKTQVELQRILVNYCNAASEEANANGLTPQRFNEITAAHRSDRKLAQSIRAAISDTKTVSIEPADEEGE